MCILQSPIAHGWGLDRKLNRNLIKLINFLVPEYKAVQSLLNSLAALNKYKAMANELVWDAQFQDDSSNNNLSNKGWCSISYHHQRTPKELVLIKK